MGGTFWAVFVSPVLICIPPPKASDAIAVALKKKAAAVADGGAEGGASDSANMVTDLTRLFHVGQYVRCTVVGLPGAAGAAAAPKSLQLSLRLRRLCAGLGPSTLHEGAVVPALVLSAEDHGYTLDLGIKVWAGVQRGLPGDDCFV